MVQIINSKHIMRSSSRTRSRKPIQIHTANSVKNIVENIERKISGKDNNVDNDTTTKNVEAVEQQPTPEQPNVTLEIVENNIKQVNADENDIKEQKIETLPEKVEVELEETPEPKPIVIPSTITETTETIEPVETPTLDKTTSGCVCNCECGGKDKHNETISSIAKYKLYHGTSKDITYVNTTGDVLDIQLEPSTNSIPHILEILVDGILEGDYDFSEQHKVVNVSLEYKLNNDKWYSCDKKKTLKLQNKSMKHYINWRTTYHFSIPKSNSVNGDIISLRLKSLIDNRRIKLTDLHFDVFVKY